MIHLSVRTESFAQEFAYALSNIFEKDVNVIKCNEKNDRGIFFKVFLASKDFYNWFYSADTFELGIKHPKRFIKGFFDSDGSFGYTTSKGRKYSTIRMIGDDKLFFERLQKLLSSKYLIRSTLKSRGVPRPTYLNKMNVYWDKEVFQLGIFNKKGVEAFLQIVEGSNKLKNKIGGLI
jgi:intein-encoded DNA endonuclease-like protein